jgi:hypothetical protein
MRKAILHTMWIAGAALASLATTSHASAASNTCWAGRTDGFCKTTCIAANAANHFVHIDVAPFAQAYHVRDCNNGIIVYSGSSGFWGVNKTITGLYARYTVYLYGALWPTGYVTINNN